MIQSQSIVYQTIQCWQANLGTHLNEKGRKFNKKYCAQHKNALGHHFQFEVKKKIVAY